MGFFRDLRQLQRAGREASKHHDPAAQMRVASAQMQQVTQQAQLSAHGTRASATVTGLRDTGTEVDMVPLTVVEVTVFPVGLPPFPSSTTVTGHAALAGLVVGSQIAIKYDPNDPSTAVLA